MWRILAAVIAVQTVVVPPVCALDFRTEGTTIRASGPIVPGDADQLRRIVAAIPRPAGQDFVPGLRVSLDSPGGDLFEGMKLGRTFRDVGATTLIQRNSFCASACAVAFLGGVVKGATHDFPKRILEFGGQLGYHGYKRPEDKVRIENQVLSEARVVNGLILSYAVELGGIDLGFLASAFNKQPEELLFIDTPAGAAAFTIQIDGLPSAIPRRWPHSACVNAVRKTLKDAGYDLTVISSSADLAQERVRDDAMPILNVADFAKKLLDDRFPRGDDASASVRSAVARLAPARVADLVSGQGLDLETAGNAAYQLTLQRGAGFYYDFCIPLKKDDQVRVLLIDRVGHSVATVSGSLLFAFPPNQQLWATH